MIQDATGTAAGSFPLRESFVDCCGRAREFIIDLSRSEDPRFLTAVEATDEQGRYEFAAMSESGPYQALGKLRRTIRRELSTRSLRSSGGRLSLSHDVLKGRIADGGVAVDGQFVSFAELLELIQSYESFHVSLEIRDPFDL
jgi:hypothetical protein